MGTAVSYSRRSWKQRMRLKLLLLEKGSPLNRPGDQSLRNELARKMEMNREKMGYEIIYWERGMRERMGGNTEEDSFVCSMNQHVLTLLFVVFFFWGVGVGGFNSRTDESFTLFPSPSLSLSLINLLYICNLVYHVLSLDLLLQSFYFYNC